MEKQIPKILYKYRGPFLCHQKNSLEKSEIFFSDPSDFNDPFDMKIRKKPELLSRESFILQMVYYKNREYPHRSFESLWEMVSSEYEQSIQTNPDFYKNKSIKGLEQERNNFRRGVFCLTEKNDNILMWSHYGFSNRGFCLGYNTKKLCESVNQQFERSGILKVQYATSYPTILPLVGDYKGLIVHKLATKSNHWSYEQEWRMIIENEAHVRVEIDREIIEEIILGANIGSKYEEEIREIQKRDFPHAKLLKVFPDESEFKLNVNLA